MKSCKFFKLELFRVVEDKKPWTIGEGRGGEIK
jgi:hypothetical protein